MQLGRTDTGNLVSDLLNRMANMAIIQKFLPVVAEVSALPTVPPGDSAQSVAGRPYIPPNTTADVLTNSKVLASSYKRTVLVAAGAGLVVGALGGYLVGKRRRR